MAIITQIVERIVEIRSKRQIPTAIFMDRSSFIKLLKESPQLRLEEFPILEGQPIGTIYGIPVKIGEPECLCGEIFTEEHGKSCFVCMVKGIPENFIQIV